MNLKTRKLVEELTQQVTTSHDLEQALASIYRLIKIHFPLQILNIHIFDANRGTLHFRAVVTDEGVLVVDEKIQLSTAAQRGATESLNSKIFVRDYPSEDPMMTEICDRFEIKEPRSFMRLITSLDEDCYGGLSIDSPGHGCYKNKHIQLMEGLFETLTGTTRHMVNLMEISSQKNRLVTELHELRKRIANRIIGEDAGLKEVMSDVDQVASLDIPVLLMGQTGVGKEIIANTIHRRSRRTEGPLIGFNCAAIPDTLIESELFGHEKGAFTGASDIKYGFFERADEGTVFLDEIGELSPKAQVKLLRFLQTKELQRVGGKHSIAVNVRVIAATNRDLESMIKKGQFREDLWYRINVFPIHIPPLSERKDDIPDLALYFAQRKSIEMNLPHDFIFAPEAMEQLQIYDWPGNVRELENIIERELIVSRGKPLSFPQLTVTQNEAVEGKRPLKPSHFPTMNEVIANHIRKSLLTSKGKIEGPGGAAELLGLNPSTLRGKMRKLHIKISRKPH